jgi:hypothetical protein
MTVCISVLFELRHTTKLQNFNFCHGVPPPYDEEEEFSKMLLQKRQIRGKLINELDLCGGVTPPHDEERKENGEGKDLRIFPQVFYCLFIGIVMARVLRLREGVFSAPTGNTVSRQVSS